MISLDYGYRSRCCFAPIRLGRRKVKNSALKIQIWICTKCQKRDVGIIEYTKELPTGSRAIIDDESSFIPKDEGI